MTRKEKEMAIKCLKWFKDYNEEDYCSGDRIKDKYDDLYYLVTEQDFEIFDMIIGWLEQEPTKTGHWERTTDKAGHLVWECKCGWQQRFYTKYCPDCGAKMEG